MPLTEKQRIRELSEHGLTGREQYKANRKARKLGHRGLKELLHFFGCYDAWQFAKRWDMDPYELFFGPDNKGRLNKLAMSPSTRL